MGEYGIPLSATHEDQFAIPLPTHPPVEQEVSYRLWSELPHSHAVITSLWQPTADQPGQSRCDIIVARNNDNQPPHDEMIYFLWSEQLAAYGMREVYDAIGFTTLQASSEGMAFGDTPVIYKTAIASIPSAANLECDINNHVIIGDPEAPFTVETIPAGRFTGQQQCRALARRIILFTADDLTGNFYNSQYWHDLQLHIPAWIAQNHRMCWMRSKYAPRDSFGNTTMPGVNLTKSWPPSA